MRSPRGVWIAGAGSVLIAAVVAGVILFSGTSGDEGTRDEGWEKHRSEFLAIAHRLSDGSNPFFGSSQVLGFRAKLEEPGLEPINAMRLRTMLGHHLMRLGEIDPAVEEFEAVFALADRHRLKLPARLLAMRALAYLRQAEVTNCIELHNRECCIFPLQGGGIHTVTGPALKAKLQYLEFLKIKPDDLEGRWLLNIAAMALGEYPEGIPERYRIPPSSFDSEVDIGRFVNIAPLLGVDTFNLCGGAIAEDFDNDGLLDIVTSTFDPAGPIAYYRNLGNGTFEDASVSSRLSDQLGGLNCMAGDYDNDGDMDVLVLRGAWLKDDGRIRNSLLRNEGDGTFSDVTREAGLAFPAYPTQAATWGDFDNDGDLDLYVGNESRVESAGDRADFPSQLFRNNGNGTFTDIAEEAGVTNDQYCKGVAAGDYDNDGHLDIYVSNVGPNRLYHNNGDGTFADLAEQAGVTEPKRRSFAVWFFDYNNDGWLDLFVVAYEATIEDIAADYLGKPHRDVSPCLYRNDGNGQFTNVTVPMGIDHPYLPMGSNFGDLDNDGYLDIYLTTGDPEYGTLTPNVMLRNDRGERFQNVTTSGGFGHLQKGHGVAFADFDHDGDQDIYNQLGGFYPGDRFRNALYLNPGHGNRHLIVQLVGTTTNRRGVGARIKVVVNTPAGPAEIHRAVGSVSSFGGSPLRQEIGLGNATAIDRLEVRWPVTSTTQVFEGIPLDAMIRITEGRDTFEPVARRRFTFQK